LRTIAPSVFLPALIYEIGNGAIAPIIALTALAEGTNAETAGFMLALLGVGQILGDIPAGALADWLGDRRAMVTAAGVAIVAQLSIYFSHSLVVLGVALTVIGMANATYYLGRVSYLTEIISVDLRARAMSTMGGSHRIGIFLGPFVGAAVISVFDMRAAYLVAVAAAAVAATLLIAVPDIAPHATQGHGARGELSSWQMTRLHRRLFATLGSAVFLVGAVRAARQTVLPLWANHLELSAERTSIIFGVAIAVEVVMFYPSGQFMDRFGRLSVALPSMLVVGLTMVLLPLTHDEIALTVLAMTMSLGNGIGSGIMMTLGADCAPRDNRIRFLAVWRLMGDSGNAAGPLIVSFVALAAGLASGIVAVGCTGLLAAAALGRWVPRYSPFARPRDMRAHREANAARAAEELPTL